MWSLCLHPCPILTACPHARRGKGPVKNRVLPPLHKALPESYLGIARVLTLARQAEETWPPFSFWSACTPVLPARCSSPRAHGPASGLLHRLFPPLPCFSMRHPESLSLTSHRKRGSQHGDCHQEACDVTCPVLIPCVRSGHPSKGLQLVEDQPESAPHGRP